MFGIWKIIGATVELQKYNENVTVNNRTMILHSLLLILQSLVAVLNALIPYTPVFLNHAALTTNFETALDLILQLMICYICITMGSHDNLCKFKITLDLTTGVPEIVFSHFRESDVLSGLLIEDSIGD